MTLFRRMAPWVVCSTLLIQGCAEQQPASVRYGLRTYPADGSSNWERPEHDRAPLRKLNPDELQDAVPEPVTLAKYGNKTPYDVMGKRYYLMPTAKGYSEVGTGSWYGEKFQGQPTSTMEPYDLYSMTAAHKTLPIPTFARVTNLDNNRSVIVKINDRGPFVDDRIIDLSYAAAVKIGYADKGTAHVRVEALTMDDAPVVTQGETRAFGSGKSGALLATRAAPSPVVTPAKMSVAAVEKPVATSSSSRAQFQRTAAAPSRVSPNKATKVKTEQAYTEQAKNELLLANNEPTAAGKPVEPQVLSADKTTEAISSGSKQAANKAPMQIAMADKQIFLQAGAFSDQKSAHSLQARLSQVVTAPVKIAKNDDSHFRVHVGPFNDEDSARQAQARIRDNQLGTPLLIHR